MSATHHIDDSCLHRLTTRSQPLPPPPTMSKQFSAKDVQEHDTVDKGLYIIIDGGVYSVASFVDEHPGGAKILKRVGGKDASKQFWKVGG